MAAASERHNKVAGEALRLIVKPALEAGDGTSGVLAILESVVAGVLTACARVDQWDERKRDAFLIALEDGVRKRLETIPAGRG